jgi:YaiO family outer membrane protein
MRHTTPDLIARPAATVRRQSRLARIVALTALVVALAPRGAAAQDDVIARARAASAEGRRAEGLALLEHHLVDSPRDVDARLTYGLMLSWDGSYDKARTELRRVLAAAPDYADAKVALLNVEWWSGRSAEARDLADQILARDPGNPQAKRVRQRLDSQSRPWTATTWYSADTFNDGTAAWHETGVSVGRETPVGSVIMRATNAARFGYMDQLVEVEAYPSFRAGTYAYVSIGSGTNKDLYPTYRTAFDLYQSVGHGLEVSGGFRRLVFSEPVSIYVGTVTQYVGPWAIMGRTFFVPSSEHDSWSFHAESRRYVGSAGRSFVGLTVSQGFSREEPRGIGDVIDLHSNTVRGQADLEVTDRVRLLMMTSASRQERAVRSTLWQFTMSAGAAYRF